MKASCRKAAIAAITIILVFPGCGKTTVTDSRLSQKFSDDLHQFIAGAARLDALTSQGVNHDKFGDQLATVSAQFQILNREWPKEFQPQPRQNLKSAMKGWQLTYRLWSHEIEEHLAINGSPSSDYEVEPKLREEAREYLTEAGVNNVPAKLHYHRTKEALLTVVSRYFNDAVNLLEK